MPAMDCSVLRIFLLISLIVTFARSDFILSTDGEYVDCVNKREQLAFDHPLLQNHRIQESPSEIPKSIIRTKSRRQTRQAHVSTANCPEGTIPVRLERTSSSQSNTNDTTVHEHAIISTKTSPEYYGAKATINVWKPMIEKDADEVSVSQVWISSGEYKTNDLNTIEVGWQQGFASRGRKQQNHDSKKMKIGAMVTRQQDATISGVLVFYKPITTL